MAKLLKGITQTTTTKLHTSDGRVFHDPQMANFWQREVNKRVKVKKALEARNVTLTNSGCNLSVTSLITLLGNPEAIAQLLKAAR